MNELRKVKIYQCDLTCKYVFMGYEYAEDKLNMDDYKMVFEYTTGVEDVNEILNDAWKKGNDGTFYIRPGMRSVSMSDIIEVDGIKYYVDTFGFKEL